MKPLTTVVNISIIRCCKIPRSASDNIIGVILSYWGNTYFSHVWILALRHFGGLYFIKYLMVKGFVSKFVFWYFYILFVFVT